MLSRSAVQAYSGGRPMTTQEERGGSQERRGENVRARLDAMITALSEAQHLAGSSDLDARVQIEFRHALDHIRHTASAVQHWFEAHAKSGDPYAVLPVLAIQRVHRATQLAKDLSLDLETMDVTVETEGLQDLYQAIGQLHRQLEVLCKRGK
jgi:hypothetical protein